MTTSNETIATQDDEAERFDLGTELVIRRHRQEAARRPPSEMIPIGQRLTMISPATSGDAAAITPSNLVMWETTLRTPTSPTTYAKPCCPHCDGAGYYKEAVPFGHPHFGMLFPCGCKLAEQAAQRIRAVDQTLARLAGGLGFLAATRLADIACDRPLDPHVEWCGVRADRDQQRESLDRAVADARRYLERPEGGVFICGPNGAGKTMLAAAILNELALTQRIAASYESAPKLLRFIQSGFKDHTADDRLDALLDVELLLIDDLGTEHKGGWNEQTLFELIDTRYKQGRRTLITANIRRKDLSKRLASRIADMVGAEIWLVVSDLREIRLRERRSQRELTAYQEPG
jgi:DNA replication protein DnaC